MSSVRLCVASWPARGGGALSPLLGKHSYFKRSHIGVLSYLTLLKKVTKTFFKSFAINPFNNVTITSVEDITTLSLGEVFGHDVCFVI